MKKSLKNLLAIPVLAGILTFGFAGAAFADDTQPTPMPTFTTLPEPVTLYGVIAWKLGPLSTAGAPFVDAQHVQASVVQTDTVNLNVFDATLPCGATYQVDAYLDDSAYSVLLSGGVLTAPSQPNAEHLAYGAPGVSGNPWKYITTDACVVSTPTPTPTVPPVVVTPPAPPTTPQLAHTGYVFPWGVFYGALAVILLSVGLFVADRVYWGQRRV